MTVTGPVDPRALGVTNPHEHLFISFLAVGAERQASHRSALEGLGADDRWEEPLSLRNYYRARRNPFALRATLQLTDVDDAVEAVALFGEAGGGCIVDVTPIGVGRDPDGLRAVAERTGVNVVMGTGYYVNDFHPAEIAGADEDGIYERIVAELEEGVGPRRIRPGIIGEIGLVWPVHPSEQTVLRAAVRAQVDYGYCLTIHPGRDPAAAIDAIQRVERAGGDPRRTIVGHLDRTLFAIDDYLELARTGCYLELDLFGLESSYYPLAEIDMPNDAMRVDRIVALAHEGFLDQVLVSLDVDTRTRLTAYGGEGYQHIIDNVTPIMRRKGLGEADIGKLLRDNPQRALTIV